MNGSENSSILQRDRSTPPKTNGKIKDILIEANMSNSALQVYKKRLLNNGLINTNTRGIIIFNLPRFKDFVLFQNELLTAQ